jgi:predicted ATPase/DNA-binding XRE family transcriptional regulator
MNLDASFGAMLKQRRKDLDLTREELAESAGCAVETLRKIETSARRPSRQIAERLADALGLSREEHAAFVRQARTQQRPEVVSELAHRAPPTPAPALAASPNRLLGRARDLAAIIDRLVREDVRLLSLIGPPGVGKTRLALQVAAELPDAFGDGVAVIALAAVSDPNLVIATIAQALAIRETASQPAGVALSAYMRSRSFLLVLDNFEQIVTAAPLLTDLLAAAPQLKILTTSRTSLHITLEHTYAVSPLALPDATRLPSLERLARVAAVELFVQRAQAVTNFALEEANAADVARICRALDGLPLAIELAAARTKLLTPSALLARLEHRLHLLTNGERDRPDRQQTLRGTIDWSYDLLNPAERRLFARLGVFVGGWSLEAAEAVCGDWGLGGGRWGTGANPATPNSQLSTPILDGLAALVDHSLVHRIEGLDRQPRFTMLETIREYALERLTANGEADSIRRQHGDYYLQFANQLHPGIFTSDRHLWLRHLDVECDNLRSALSYALDRGDADMAMRLGRVMLWFWGRHGLLSEGRERLAMVLTLDPGDDSPQRLIHAQALVGAGQLDSQHGDNHAAQSHLQAALTIFEQQGERHSIASTLLDLGQIAFHQQYYDRAQLLLEQSLTIFTELADQRGIDDVRCIRGMIAWAQGQYATAEQLLTESLTNARQRAAQWEVRGNWDIGGTLATLGMIAWSRGDYVQAHTLHTEQFQLAERLGNHSGRSHALLNLGIVAWLRGDYTRAIELHAQSLELARQMQATLLIAWSLRNLATDVWSLGDYARATALHKQSLPVYYRLFDRWGIVECLEGLAWAACSEGKALADNAQLGAILFTRATRLLGATDAIRHIINGQMAPGYRVTNERVVAILQHQLGAAAFATAWDAGMALSLDQAVDEALNWRYQAR